jgi:tRNA nucleotidyltransferase (CCA-adding enzyme)
MNPRWPEAVVETARRLERAGLRGYVVGGAVRDLLLGRDTRDFDLLIEGRLEDARRAVPEATYIGARTPVLVLPGRGQRPRIEILEPRVGARNLEEDLRLRDFTLNGMGFDLSESALIDPLGGRADLEARRLVAVDPECGLRVDPVRTLRGVRLAVELELTVDPETERAMQRDAWRLSAAPGERLREELFRALRLPAPSTFVEKLRRIGALAALLPELLRTVAIAQNRYHGEDVYRHTLRVTDGVEAEPLVRLAALLHDVAKPETKLWIERRKDFSFLRHEHLGQEHVARVARRLRLSRREEKTVANLVKHHLLFPDRLGTGRAIRRMLVRVGDDILPALLDLRCADLASRDPSGRAGREWEETVRRIERERAGPKAPGGTRLELSGRDVMGVLGIGEGPEVGRWLQRARRRVVERPEENDRERLVAWLRGAYSASEGS